MSTRAAPRRIVFARVALFLAASAVVLAIMAPLAARRGGLLAPTMIGAVTSASAFVLTMVFVRWDGIRLRDVGGMLSCASLARTGTGAALGALLIAVYCLVLRVSGHVRWVRASGVSPTGVAITLISYLLLATREELSFHGYPLRRLISQVGVWPAQIMIALAFAAEHVAGGASWPAALAGSGIGSLLFGMASIATGGLALPIGLHAAWNSGDWLRGGKDASGPWRMVVAPGYERRTGWLAWGAYVALMGGATAALWIYHRRARSSAQMTA